MVETRVASQSFTISVQGTLSIDTSPVKGEVFVDNVSWGLAPASRLVAAGPHSIRFGYVAGYTMPATVSITVEADRESTVLRAYVIGEGFKVEPWMIVGGAMAAAVAILFMSGRRKS